jgi:hypothetical protein
MGTNKRLEIVMIASVKGRKRVVPNIATTLEPGNCCFCFGSRCEK